MARCCEEAGVSQCLSQNITETTFSYGLLWLVHICMCENDQEVFTSSLLHLQEGNYFSEDEFVASDGAFECEGHLRCS